MTGEPNKPIQAAASRRSYFAALRFALPPLAVMMLADVIFSLIASDIDQVVGELQGLLGSGEILINPFVEAQARLTWGTTVLLFYSIMIAVSVFCLAIIRQFLAGTRKLVFAAVGTFITMAVLGHLVYSAHFRNEFSYIFYFTFDSLTASKYYTASQLTAIKGLVSGINVLASMVIALALIAGCCIMAGTRERNKAEVDLLVDQMRQLKIFIGIVSTFLVSGVLHMIAWLHWPTVLIADNQLAQQSGKFSEAMGLYWGATFSLLIATFYIPTAWSLSKRTKMVIAEQIGDMEEVQDCWIQKHNMSLAPLQQVPQLIAMIAPLLAGPLGATFEKLSRPFGGG
jgi:hypothetical protein